MAFPVSNTIALFLLRPTGMQPIRLYLTQQLPPPQTNGAWRCAHTLSSAVHRNGATTLPLIMPASHTTIQKRSPTTSDRPDTDRGQDGLQTIRLAQLTPATTPALTIKELAARLATSLFTLMQNLTPLTANVPGPGRNARRRNAGARGAPPRQY